MGFRPDLDLSGFIDDYRPWFGGKSLAGVQYVRTEAPERDITDFDPIPDLYRRPERNIEEPLRIGNGPPTCSSSQVLARTKPMFSWDVNRYYRTLGVPWPYVNATKTALSKAYIAADGAKSAYKTYCLKQLLDKRIRAEYDAMPFGSLYLEDDYIQDAIKARAAAEAGKRTAAGVYTEAESVMDEWGYKLLKDLDLEVLDTGSSDEQDEPRSPDRPGFDPIEWTYSYWVWRSTGAGTDLLAEWQALLVSALSEVGATVNFAVGYLGRQPHPFVIGQADGHWIVYANDRLRPSKEVAASAAKALLHDMKHDSTTRT